MRLYSVDDTGRRGIVFLSLDADRAAVVPVRGAAFGLPYRWARMRTSNADGGDVHRYAARLRWPARAASRIAGPGGRSGGRRARWSDFLTARWGLHVATGA